MTETTIALMSAPQLHRALSDENELALIDIREQGRFGEAHILLARCVPASRLELDFPLLVPRPSTRIVLCDDDDGLASVAHATLARHGYQNVSILEGGIPAWVAAGYEVFSGINVPSKAFGEMVEHHYATPSIEARELAAKIGRKEDVLILDSRPLSEYEAMSIPGARCVPGAELVYRIAQLAHSNDTLIVVNCAGRTRSILGAQSLINAGIANRVVALKNGTMGWHLSGLELEQGQTRYLPELSTSALATAKQASAKVAERFAIDTIDRAKLEQWRGERAHHTLYVFDVRSPEEFVAGHLSDAISAPGGQLVQATDRYIGTLRSRIVLVDNDGVRATMTASWLKQMGYEDIKVFAEEASRLNEVRGPMQVQSLPLGTDHVPLIAPLDLKNRMTNPSTLVIDVGSSLNFKRAHIGGAQHAVRARLREFLQKHSASGNVVLTCEDGVLARYAALGAQALTNVPVFALNGGNAGWASAGLPLEAGADGLGAEPDDVWLRPYDRSSGIEDAMHEYLAWEIGLVEQFERDGTLHFALPE